MTERERETAIQSGTVRPVFVGPVQVVVDEQQEAAMEEVTRLAQELEELRASDFESATKEAQKTVRASIVLRF